MNPIDILFLSQQDVMSLKLSTADTVTVIKQALIEHANGTFEMHPKIGVHPVETHPANFIHAMPAYLKKLGACGLKWVGGFANNYKHNLPNISGISIYNDVSTGVPLAVMDCGFLTGMRTAAVSAVAASLCARKGSTVLALAGCGFQGRMHLKFITSLIPSITSVRLIDVRKESADALKKEAEEYFGGEINVCSSNEECIRDADVISTCTNGDDQIIEKGYFKNGACGVGIEGGCAYTEASFQSADKFLVDDIPLARYFDEIGKKRLTADGKPDPEFPGGLPPVYATIGEVASGKKQGRESDQERIIIIPIGMAICDIALTKLAYDQAVKNGVGRKLRLV